MTLQTFRRRGGARAAGLHYAEVAVELLIGHAVWLRRSDFAGEYVESDGDTAG